MFDSPIELINSHLSSRLAPVPEESTDDMMFRSDVYDFPALMGKLLSLYELHTS